MPRKSAVVLVVVVLGCSRASAPPTVAAAPPPSPAPPVTGPPPAAAAPPAGEAGPLSGGAAYASLFTPHQTWRLAGTRHVLTSGGGAGTLHYKVNVECEVAEVVTGDQAVAARIVCTSFPADARAKNPLAGVWVASGAGLFRAEALPAAPADWSRVLGGEPVLPEPLRALERAHGDCREAVVEAEYTWCWSRTCAGEAAQEAKVCFAKQGGLASFEAHAFAATSDMLALTVVPVAAP